MLAPGVKNLRKQNLHPALQNTASNGFQQKLGWSSELSQEIPETFRCSQNAVRAPSFTDGLKQHERKEERREGGKRGEGRGEMEEEEKEGRRQAGRNQKGFIYPECRI